MFFSWVVKTYIFLAFLLYCFYVICASMTIAWWRTVTARVVDSRGVCRGTSEPGLAGRASRVGNHGDLKIWKSKPRVFWCQLPEVDRLGMLMGMFLECSMIYTVYVLYASFLGWFFHISIYSSHPRMIFPQWIQFCSGNQDLNLRFGRSRWYVKQIWHGVRSTKAGQTLTHILA